MMSSGIPPPLALVMNGKSRWCSTTTAIDRHRHCHDHTNFCRVVHSLSRRSVSLSSKSSCLGPPLRIPKLEHSPPPPPPSPSLLLWNCVPRANARSRDAPPSVHSLLLPPEEVTKKVATYLRHQVSIRAPDDADDSLRLTKMLSELTNKVLALKRNTPNGFSQRRVAPSSTLMAMSLA
jgi:hypothetical protein